MALQAANAQNLALAQLEAGAADALSGGQVAHFQRHAAGAGGEPFRIEPVELAAEHL